MTYTIKPGRFLLLALLAFAVGSPTGHAADGDSWMFDKQHTEIRFSWDYLGLSRRSGRFLDMDGTLTFSPTDPENGVIDMSIRTASLSTGTRELDDALRSPDFFGTTTHPRIMFRSIAITRTGERTGELAGELTIRGISRPVTLATTWNFTGEHPLASSNPTFQGKWVAGFSATTKVQRSDFGIKRGIPLLSDEIRIDIDAVFLRKE